MDTTNDTLRFIERRTAPRTSTRIPVELAIRGLQAPLPGRAVDIGPSGICVSTPSRIPFRDVRGVSLLLGKDRLSVSAEGRWQRLDNSGRGLVAGLMFLDVDARTASLLRSHVYDAALAVARFLLEKTEITDLQIDDAIDTALLTRSADYNVGRRIYEEGKLHTRGDSLFIVESGSVVLEAQRSRVDRVVLDRIEPGGIFAGLPLLAEAAHGESAIAATQVAMIEIDSYSFASLESTRPRVARALSRAVLRRRAASSWPAAPVGAG